ncbi:uncharacterized protein [Arachis hypogaea]|uniref:uncharacterized protein n=1 Tax=Arachis hypogaea TaxID=3818 RepID=UPI003B228705
MPFGLKNTRVTYQRLMNKVFADNIEKLMEVFVDDMLEKTQKEETLLPDLVEVFRTIRKHGMSQAIASALVREDDNGQQPIYFINKALQGDELNYQKIEKFSYALILTSRRLRPYFQAHTIRVRINQPMKGILEKTDLAGRILQWAVELSKFDLKYEGRTVVESQYMADFIAEYTDTLGTPIEWNLYVNSSSNKAESGAGVILKSDQGTQLELSLRFEFPASNNQTEYEALLAGLKLAREVGEHKLTIFSDSQVITSQIDGSYQAKDLIMKKYLDKTKEQLGSFSEYTIRYIPRE